MISYIALALSIIGLGVSTSWMLTARRLALDTRARRIRAEAEVLAGRNSCPRCGTRPASKLTMTAKCATCAWPYADRRPADQIPTRQPLIIHPDGR